jgi:hypothetical protein
MKARRVIVWLAAVLAAGSLSARPGPGHPRFSPDGPPPDAPPGRHLEMWMERLAERDPEEYERLANLYRTNHPAFRRALHQRLREARRRMAAEPFGMSGPHDGPSGGPDPGADNPEIAALREEIRDLATRHREALEGAERETLRERIRDRVVDLLRLREAERFDALERAEARLREIRGMLEARRGLEDEIVERRVRSLLGEDSPAR